jgi:hypothetical protein
MKRIKGRYLTLLEVMLVIALVAITGGTIFWRLDRLSAKKKLETDMARLRSVLLSSRMLAMNTKSDWQLEIEQTKGGWAIQLVSLEELGVQIGCGTLSSAKLQLTELKKEKSPQEERANPPKSSDRVVLQLFATGQVRPAGILEFHKDKIEIPSFFQQTEGNVLGPIHPDDLPREK